MRKSTKLLWGALLVAVMLLTASMGVFAEGTDPVVDMTYKSGQNAVEVLNAAIAEAEKGQTVNLKLEANMTINETSVVGVAGRTHNGQVNIYSEVTDGATPTLGITLHNKATLKMYGNFNFDDIRLDVTATEWSGGGCYMFIEGMGTIGHDQTNDNGDFGNVKMTNKPNLAGHVTVYTGTYNNIVGNYYNTGETVESPYLKVAGNSSANYLVGGIFIRSNNASNSSTTKIEERSEIHLLNNAKVTRFVGGDLQPSDGYGPNGARVFINTSNTVDYLWFTSFSAGGATPFAVDKNYEYKIEDVTVNSYMALGETKRVTSANLKIDIEISGGTYKPTVYFGPSYTASLTSGAAISGNMGLKITGGTFEGDVYFGGVLKSSNNLSHDNVTKVINIEQNPEFKGDVYGGSHIETKMGSYPNAPTTITIAGGTFEKNFYGGSYINSSAQASHRGNITINYQGGTFKGDIYNGSNIPEASTGAVYHRGNTTVTVSGNGFSISNTGKFYGGSSFAGTGAAYHFGETNITINDATIGTAALYGGSLIDGTGGSYHSGKITITINGATISKALYGGSRIQATVKDAKHSGEVAVTVNEGSTFSSYVIAGSDLASGVARHTGKTTLVFQGGTDVIKTASHIAGGSWISAHNAIHSGESIIRFNNCISETPAASYKDAGTKNLSMTGGDVFGGSQIGANATHSGNSKVEFINCYYSGARSVYAGSRMDGIKAVHSGTSELVIDGSEWGYYKAFMLGGSFVNGSNKGTGHVTRHTGFSKVNIIGPSTEDRDANDVMKQLVITGEAKWLAIYGGNRYGANPLLPQTNDSEVIISGYVDLPTGSGMRIYGGSFYSNAAVRYDYENFANHSIDYRLPTTRVTLKGVCEVPVVGGFLSVLTGGSPTNMLTMKQNSAIVLMDGATLPNSSYASSYSADSTGYIDVEGIALIEIYSDSGIEDGDTLYNLTLTQVSTTTPGIKFIGEFNDKDADGVFKIYAQRWVGELDIIQTNFSENFTFRVRSIDDSVAQANPPIAQYFTGREVFFLKPEGTSATINTTQVEVNPTMSVADLLATTGLKIYTTTAGKVNQIPYANMIKLDAASTSPNEIKLYLVDEKGIVGKATEKIPASPKQKVVIKIGTAQEGAITTLPSTLNHAFKVVNKSLTLESSLTANYKIMPAIIADYGYTNVKVVVSFGGVETVLTEVKEERFDGDDAVNNRDYFEFKGIAPQGIGDVMTVTLTATYEEEEVEAYSFEYSVKEYCMNMLAKNMSNKLNTLIVDLLNYGAAAQTYGSYKPEALVNADLTEEQLAFGTQELRPLTSVKDKAFETINNPTATIGAGLSLQNSIMLRFKVTLNGPITETIKLQLTNITRSGSDEVAYGKFEQTAEENVYYVYVDGLNADQASDVITATVYDGDVAISNTYRYSIESYAESYYDSTTYPKVAELVKAIIKYSDAAKAYANPAA